MPKGICEVTIFLLIEYKLLILQLYGLVAERLGGGLQNHSQRFESARDLIIKDCPTVNQVFTSVLVLGGRNWSLNRFSFWYFLRDNTSKSE